MIVCAAYKKECCVYPLLFNIKLHFEMVSVRANNPNVFYYIRALETSLKQVEYVISILEMITANAS
jgi:hypothetical protein